MLGRPSLLASKNDQDQGHERGSCLELTRKTSCEECYGDRPRTEHSIAGPRRRAQTGALASCSRRFLQRLDSGRSGAPKRHAGGRWQLPLLSLSQPSFGHIILHHLNRAWLAFGKLLHRIVSPIVMSAIFFICVTPTAWIMRIRGKDLLSLKRRPDLKTYWIEREP